MALEEVRLCLIGVDFVFDGRTTESMERAFKDQLVAESVKVTERKRQRTFRGNKYDVVDVEADGFKFVAGISKGSYMFNNPEYSSVSFVARK